MTEAKYQRLFDTEHIRANLKEHSVRGGAATLSCQVGRLVLRMLSIAVLARLLAPNDFGLIAMVTAITAFLQIFMDIGLSTATIQRERITHHQASNLFWVNVLTGFITMGIVMSLSYAIVWFYDEPRLLTINLLLSLSFILGGLTVQHRALLTRQMRFGLVAIVELVAMALSVFIAIVLAWFWREGPTPYLALVYMQLAQYFFLMLGMWLLCPWIPAWFRRGVGTRPLLKFGAGIMGFNIVNYFARNADKLLIGKFNGADALAFYAKSYQFLLLPIQQFRGPIASVATPAMSTIHQDPEAYGKYMSRVVQVLAFFTMPMMSYSAVCADTLVRCFFGTQWLDAIPLFRVMSILGIIQPVAGLCGLIPITRGEARRYFLFGVGNSAFIIASFFIGISRGALGVAQAYTVVSFLLLLPSWWYCARGSSISTGLFLRAIARPAVGSTVMALVLYAARLQGLAGRHPVVDLLLTGACGAALYLACYLLTPGGRNTLREYGSYVTLLLKSSRASPPPPQA